MSDEPINPKPIQPIDPNVPPQRPKFSEPLKPGEKETYIERVKKITQRIRKRVKKPVPALAETEEEPEEMEEPGQEEPEDTEEQESEEEQPEEEKKEDEEPEEKEDVEKPEENEEPEKKPEEEGEPKPEGEAAEAGPEAGAEGGLEGGVEETEVAGEAAEAVKAEVATTETAAAATEAVAAEGTVAAAPILPYILIAVAIILGVVAIIVLIVLIFSVLKGAGRSTPQYPDYTKSADAGAAGKVLAASQANDASLIAKAAGIETQSADQKINSANNQNDSLAQQQTDKLTTNASALANSLPTQKNYVKEKIQENKEIVAGLTNPGNQTNIEAAKKQVNKIATDYNAVLSLDKPILQINPFDLQMIKSGQVDKRIIAVLAKLVDFSLAQTGENKDRWSQFKIGKIYKSDPYDKQETPLEEDQQFISAHHFGQAIDITVVGKIKCSTNYWVISSTKWYPCNVSYQGGGPQNSPILGSQNYASFSIPDALSGAAATLGNINTGNTRNFYDLFSALGQQTIQEEMGIDQTAWDENTPFTPEKILASYFSQKTSIPIQAISQFLLTRDTKSLDRGMVEAQLKLPAGSLEGSNWNEISKNAFRAYTRQTLGLQGTDITDFNSNQELGKAILEKSFGTQSDGNKIFDGIKRSNTYYQNLWQLSDSEMSQAISKPDLNNLENLIGAKFKDGFIQTAGSASMTHWLGLPDGNLSDSNYQIAAGRYVLAKALNLSDQNQAFQNNDYFLKNGPYSSNVSFDLCAGLKTGTNCPAYNMFKDPNAFFKNVGDALIAKKDTDLDLGNDFGSIFDQNLGTNKISLTDLAKILASGTKKDKLDNALNILIQATLKDNLEISTELPGLFSENQIKNGNFSFVIPLLGLNFVSQNATLPPNTLEKLFLPNIKVEDVFKEIAGYQALEALGVNPWSLDKSTLPDNWFKDPQQFSTVAMAAWLGNFGIDVSSLDKNGKLQLDITSFDQMRAILAGDAESNSVPDSLAAFLGMSNKELQTTLNDLKTNKDNATIQLLLSQTADKRLGLDSGATYALLTGGANFNDWLKQGWQNDTLLTLANQQASLALDLPEGTNIDLSQLVNGLKNNDSGQLTDFMLSVGEAKLGDTFQLPIDQIPDFFNSDGDYKAQIDGLKNLAIEKLAQTIASNKDQYDILIGLYNTYLQSAGNEQELNNYISSILHIPESDGNFFSQNNLPGALSVLGAAQIANQAYAVLGDRAISYNEVRKIFFGDQAAAKPTNPNQLATYQSNQNQIKQTALKDTGFSLADAALIKQDASIPVGTAKILAEGTTDQKNMLFVDYISNKAGIDPAIIKDVVLNGNFNLQNLDVTSFVASLPGIGQYAAKINQIQTAFSDLQTFAKTQNIDSFSSASAGFIEQQTGIPIASYQQMQNAIQNPSDLNSQLFIANQIGLTSAIDKAVGMPGFSSFAVNAATCYASGGSNFASCANAVLQVMNWLGFGKTTCESLPATAQQQVRTTIGLALNTDPTPTKIITLRPQDVYYFAGLNDQGETTQGLVDLLTQKYGTLDTRGDKGMFTSPTMWDHVHVGY